MADIEMQGVVEPTYNKRRKGYTFKMDDMEVFVKGEDKDDAIRQMQELLDTEDDKEETEVSRFAEGGMEEGGLKDEGGSVDPVSGNDVPSGSTKKEVRDDIPAQLSEGEFVFPADVVRYIGLENLMELRQKAKMGLQRMEDMGQMGNSEEAVMDDDGPYKDDIDKTIEAMEPAGGPVLAIGIGPAPEEMAQGGMPRGTTPTVEQEMMQRQGGMKMAQGGAVMSVEQEMMQKSRDMNMQVGGYVPPPSPMMGMPTQQQNIGMPSNAVSSQPMTASPMQNSQVPMFNEGGVAMGAQAPSNTRLGAAQSGLGLTNQRASQYTPQYSQRQYYNPETNEIRVINFINGQPAPPGIPAGFQPYDPATAVEEATKESTKELQVDRGDGDGADKREQERQRDYADYLTELNVLSEFSPTFNEFVEKNMPAQKRAAETMTIDPETGIPSFPDMGFTEALQGLFGGERFTALAEGVKGVFGENETEKAYSEIANNLGFSLDDYKTEGFLGFEQFNKKQMVDDLQRWSNLDDNQREERRETADRYGTNPISEQTDMLAEQDRGLFDDDDDNGTGDLTSTSDLGGDSDFTGSRGVDEDRGPGGEMSGGTSASEVGGEDDNTSGPFAKGGVVKQRKKKGLGRLKTK